MTETRGGGGKREEAPPEGRKKNSRVLTVAEKRDRRQKEAGRLSRFSASVLLGLSPRVDLLRREILPLYTLLGGEEPGTKRRQQTGPRAVGLVR